MADISNTGTTIYVLAQTPGTKDLTAFQAQTYTAIVGELSKWSGGGDESAEIENHRVSGRTTSINGGVKHSPIDFEYAFEPADAGQVIIRANANNQTFISVKEVHTDGKIVYYGGILANVKYRDITDTTSKGQTGILRVNTGRFST